MSDSDKQIHDWQEKVRSEFGHEAKLYHYLFETMDNFYYRYLETSLNKDLKTKELSSKTYGGVSFENNMVDALKIKNPKAKPGIMELAKTVPRSENPTVRYSLMVTVNELGPEHGDLLIQSEIHWGFPDYTDPGKSTSKKVKFTYTDLTQFRKELALKLEEVSDIFL